MRLILVFSVLALALSCRNSKDTVNSKESRRNNHTTQSANNCEPLVDFGKLKDTTQLADAHILSYKQVNSCVCIKYYYSGCRKGKLITDYRLSPPSDNIREVSLRLRIDGAGYCDQLLTDSTCFDLSPLPISSEAFMLLMGSAKRSLKVNKNWE